ncbi:HAMP domain-containing protein [Cohnella sp. CFH 77786]|uniref:sensor histidine kinase n=1 Tax=Cohnella sp. CFH 77786 TaxID=2662265 RepID=UPI001C60E30B|nr:HAMP domain-containing sensor histidine kinase [Cohnella sp. CFH 77786]MBW5448779.1 HAMP domain-containing protein [Cohnella sp. CFH 77786]
MIRNLRIGGKIRLHNLLLIMTVLLVAALVFHVLSGRYLLQEAKKQLKEDAESIALSLKGTPALSGRIVAERIANRAKLKLVGRTINSRLAIVDADNRILYTNASRNEINTLRELSRKDDRGYLVQRREIRSPDGQLQGRMILAIEVKDVNGLNRVLRGAEWASALIGALAALLMGSLLARTITRPVRNLAAAMKQFSPKKEVPQVSIRSQDEIGELAQSFQVMASQLQAHDRLQSEFLQNASHELKTPLMTIQGNAEAVKDGIVTGEEAEQSLDLIVAECQRLKGLVDELIYLTRLEQTTELYRFEPVRIGDVIEAAMERVRGLAEQQGIRMMLEGDLDRVGNFDREKLMRALLNIAGNGVRYAGTFLRFEVKANGNLAQITCTDDGKGFAPGEAAKVFDRFYKGEQGGTGIGLSMAKVIIEAHGGKVQADQGIPAGAVFRILLPLNPGEV